MDNRIGIERLNRWLCTRDATAAGRIGAHRARGVPMRSLGVTLVVGTLGLALAHAAAAQDATGELEAFGALVVGTWRADDAKHVHTWGVGKKLIHSASYFLVDGEWKLVSEGIWYWDDQERTIRSTHVAIDMPVERFEYRTEVKGALVEHELTAYGSQPGDFVEIWSFHEDGYDWRLESPDDRGTRVMGGSFRRTDGG